MNTNNKLEKKEKRPPPRLPNITNGNLRFKKRDDKNIEEPQTTTKQVNNNNASLKFTRFRPIQAKKENLNDKTNTTIETNTTDMSNETTESKPIRTKSNNNNEFLKKRLSISHSLDPKVSKSKYPIVPKNKKYILNTRKSFRKSIDVGSKPQTPRTPRKENQFNLNSLEPFAINDDIINKVETSEISDNKKPVKIKNSYSIKYNRPIKPIKNSNKLVKEKIENTSIPTDNDTQNEKHTI
jgi:hypothetical protein